MSPVDFYLRRSHAGQWMINLLCVICLMEAFRGQISMATWVIEVTEFNSKARCDLRGCLEAAMASEVTKMAVRGLRGNMHNDTRVMKVADFKYEVKFEL